MEKANIITCIERSLKPLILLAILTLTVASCDTGMNDSMTSEESIQLEALKTVPPSSNGDPIGAFTPVAYDLEAAPDGGILFTQNGAVQQVRKGVISTVVEIPGNLPNPANGLALTGRSSFFLTSGGLDLALGAGVWHVSKGKAQLIGDIEAFEIANDPDAYEGTQWKAPECEEDSGEGFTTGPQSNPYHMAALNGSTVLVGDAAGNSVLSVNKNGNIELVAVLTPPVDGNGDYRFLKTAEDDPSIDCYVQPVATSVAIAPNGDYFVGELTGAPATPGWSRIWRIEAGATNVACPSSSCSLFADGLTSVIDLELGPDGMLYAVEYDVEGWAVATAKAFNPMEDLAGGTIKMFDTNSGNQVSAITGLQLPSAITFDKKGHLWVLENNLTGPTIRTVSMP